VLIASLGVVAPAIISGCSREPAAPAVAASAVSARESRDIATLVADYCGSCHAPPRPQGYAPAAWPAIIARMLEHRRRAGLPDIPAEDLDTLLGYLRGSGGNT